MLLHPRVERRVRRHTAIHPEVLARDALFAQQLKALALAGCPSGPAAGPVALKKFHVKHRSMKLAFSNMLANVPAEYAAQLKLALCGILCAVINIDELA